MGSTEEAGGQKESGRLLIPRNDEVIKSRDLGRTITSLTRLQRVGFASLLRHSYQQMLADPNRVSFSMPTSTLLKDMGIEHRNIFSITTKTARLQQIQEEKLKKSDFSDITLDDIPSNEKRLQDHLVELQLKKIQWKYKDGEGKMTFASHVMLPSFEMNDSSVTWEFTTFIRERILCRGNAYIASMSTISSLKGGYSVALYDLLLQKTMNGFNFKQSWVCDIDDLKEYLGGLELKLKAMRKNNFKLTIVDKAVAEINLISDFNVTVSNIKNGREVVSYKFEWEKKAPKEKAEITTGCEIIDNSFSCQMGAAEFGSGQSEHDADFADFIEYVRKNIAAFDLFGVKYKINANMYLVKSGKILKSDLALKEWEYCFKNKESILNTQGTLGTILSTGINIFDICEMVDN